MNENQLKSLIRTAFRLQAVSDRLVEGVDPILATTMAVVRNLVELLPDDGLFRSAAWKELEPLVRTELRIYGDRLGQALTEALAAAEPGMEAAAVREVDLARVKLPPPFLDVRPEPIVTDYTAKILRTQVNDTSLRKLFGIGNDPGRQSPVNRTFFNNVDQVVKKGILDGTPTEEIAEELVKQSERLGVQGVNLNEKSAAKKIRTQAQAISRTAVQDYNRQIKEAVYREMGDALEGMVWEHTAAFDSRTCETCMALDGMRWEQDDKRRPQTPIHIACRCTQVLISPDDPFWNENEKTIQVIRPKSEGRYSEKGKGTPYKTPVEIKGQKYYRKAVDITSDTPPPKYTDALQYWAKNSQTSLRTAMGSKRADIFTRALNKENADPQQILLKMLRGRPGAQQWIPLKDLPADLLAR